MRKEVLFNDLAKICKPNECISEKRIMDKWTAYYYETGKFCGNMLVAPYNSRPDKVWFNPELCGWYKIYVGLYNAAYSNAEVRLKLTGDRAYSNMSACVNRNFGEHIVEEVFWKCAEMDGKTIEIGKNSAVSNNLLAAIAWIRCVPMTDDEIEQYTFEKNRTDTKRIYATNDMHCVTVACNANEEEPWLNVVQEYIDSDVEWLAIENIFGHKVEKDMSNFSYFRNEDKMSDIAYKKGFPENILKKLVEYGQEIGLKMCVSLRVAQWCSDFPFDGLYFDSDFRKNNPHLRCVDRDGDVTDYMSYIYPEVQDYIIEHLVSAVDTGCDAIQPLFSRGWPFVLFEQPFVDMFKKKYDEDPRVLPLDDERIVELKCEIMTGFVEKLRARLDVLQKDKRVELHIKVINSVYDCRIVGLDVEEWAKRGLVDIVISDCRRVWETLPEYVWQDNDKTKIDTGKYREYANNSTETVITYFYEDQFPQMPDSKGELAGPASMEERVKEFAEIEKKYGMKCYIELMPRMMSPETIKERALELYDAGCEHIGLWDTYSRVCKKAQWNMWRRIGHKAELKDINPYDENFIRIVRLNKIGDKNVRSYKGVWGL